MTSATNTLSSTTIADTPDGAAGSQSAEGQNVDAETSTLWQTYVLPSVAWGEAADTMIRVDNAYASISGPRFLDCWHADVGWHRRLDELSETQLPKRDRDPESSSANSGVMPSPSLRFAAKGESHLLAKSSKDESTGDATRSEVEDRIAEVAHDIRSPIAVAKQIVTAVAEQAQSTGKLSGGEIELLEVAAMRLVEANKWAEGVLVQRCLQEGTPINIRRRFYPSQWKAAVQPLLHGVAARKRIRLQWTGWDRSLPRLYLDENQLTRVVLNLVTNAIEASRIGSEVAIRVAVHNNVTQQLALAIEDKGNGLSAATLRQINSNAPADLSHSSTGSGFGLGVAKNLIVSLGGRLRAEKLEAGGTLIRLTLPTDSPQSLLRSWLVQGLTEQSGPNDSGSVEMFAVRCTGLASQFVDTQLQQSAGRQDFVYRVGADRWLWMTRGTSNMRTTSLPPQLDDALRRLRGMQGRSLTQQTCNGQLIYRIQGVDRNQGADDLNKRVTEVAHLLSSQIERVMGGRVPSVDDLSIQAGSIVFRTNEQGGTRQVRQDIAGSVPMPAMSRHRGWDAGEETQTVDASGTKAGTQSTLGSTRRRVDTHGNLVPESKSSVLPDSPGGEAVAAVQQIGTPELTAGQIAEQAGAAGRPAILPSQRVQAVRKDLPAPITDAELQKAIREVNNIWKNDLDIITYAHRPLSETARR